jgi:hypothetical protein
VWHRSKENPPSSGAAARPALNGPALSAGAEASVRQLIASGKHKAAVETAKEIHKAQATAASEALLVDAYAGRIQSLIDRNLAGEAKALLELVRERYPSAWERLNGRNGSAGIGAGRQNKKPIEEMYFLYPEKLYERACALDPHFESFSQWMEWAKGGRAGQAAKVAEAWHKIRPVDIEPILLLMEEKEKRNAFQTSLQYLAKAERIDSVHPAVRRARLRLLAGSALRHLQQKKPHLAEQKLAEMGTLPQSQQGDRPAYLAALRYMVCAVRGAGDGAAAHRAEVERVLGSKAAAALLIFGVAHASKQGALEEPPPIETLGKTEHAALPEAVIRVIELAKDMQTVQPVPGDWLTEMAKQFPRSSPSLNVGQLQTLAEAGLYAERFELAYAVSAAGLRWRISTRFSAACASTCTCWSELHALRAIC